MVKICDMVAKNNTNIDVSSFFENVNVFINENIEFVDNYKSAKIAFAKIVDFMKKNKLTFTPQLCIYLIDNNEIINIIFEKIVTKNKKKIVSNNYKTLFDGYDLIFIDLYCSRNNIDIIRIDKNDDSLLLNEYDSFKTYISSLTLPILSTEEQLELGKIVALGRDKNATLKEKRAAKKAKDKLITHNMRLSFNLAKKYSKYIPEASVIDLAQEGYFGLEEAVLRYDPTLEVKFSTYAIFWIRKRITKYICEMHQLPPHLEKYLVKYSKAYSEYALENEQKPSIEEIAEKINVPINNLKRIEECVATKVSLNMKTNDEESTELGEIIPSEDLSPDQEFEKKEAEETIKKILDELALSDPRYKFVIIHRKGLFGETEKTLTEVRDLICQSEKNGGLDIGNITIERIRQMEESALKLMEKIGKKYIYAKPKREKKIASVHAIIPYYRDKSTIFSLFEDYTEEEVLKAIYMLSNEDIDLIIERYGDNLHTPIIGQLWNYTKEEIFVKNLVPKIKNNLLILRGKTEEISNYNSELKLRVLIDMLANDNKCKIASKDVRLLQSVINDNLFLEYISKLTLVEKKILIRRLEYVNNNFTSISKICKETGYSREIVEECIRKHFNNYNKLRTAQVKKYYKKNK